MVLVRLSPAAATYHLLTYAGTISTKFLREALKRPPPNPLAAVDHTKLAQVRSQLLANKESGGPPGFGDVVVL